MMLREGGGWELAESSLQKATLFFRNEEHTLNLKPCNKEMYLSLLHHTSQTSREAVGQIDAR